jgi:hypothetical protein
MSSINQLRLVSPDTIDSSWWVLASIDESSVESRPPGIRKVCELIPVGPARIGFDQVEQ